MIRIILIQRKIVLLFLLLFSVSCEKFLPEINNEYDLFDTEQECIDGLAGAYTKMSQAFTFHNILTVKSDDINLVIRDNMCYQESSDDHDAAEEFYRLMYKSVIMCNRLIHDLENFPQTENLDQYRGEAYFLRAYLYFKLTRIYGKIPLVRDIHVDYELHRAEFEDVYLAILSDIEVAGKLLPGNRNSSRIPGVTPHLGTVLVLKSEVYLAMGGYPLNRPENYELAAATAREAILNAGEFGFGLVDDFADLWAWDTHANEESILRFYKEPEGFDDAQYYNVEKWWTFKTPTEVAYYKSFPAGYRKDVTFTTQYVDTRRYDIDGIRFETKVMVDMDPDDPCLFYRKCMGKKQTFNFHTNYIRSNPTYIDLYDIVPTRTQFWDLKQKPGEDIFSTYFHIFRYPHTLLTYAEASARAGTTDDLSYEAVNMVRRRARKLDPQLASEFDLLPGITDNQAFIDSVVSERSWEFCHELEGRWFDIIRLDLMDEVTANRASGDVEFMGMENLFKGEKYFIPLPLTDQWLNPNLYDEDNIDE